MELEWENISFSIGRKLILDNVSGKVSSGELLAGRYTVRRKFVHTKLSVFSDGTFGSREIVNT